MGKVRKSFRYGEKGLTLIELLIVVAILGILAAVILPNVGGFLSTGNLAAANSEVATMKTASAAYYSNNGTYPTTSVSFAPWLDKTAVATYTFSDVTTIVAPITPADWGHGFTFNFTTQQWE